MSPEKSSKELSPASLDDDGAHGAPPVARHLMNTSSCVDALPDSVKVLPTPATGSELPAASVKLIAAVFA
jgi:hypothetical protein